MKLDDIYTYALLASASYVQMGGSRDSAMLVANASTEAANRLPVSIGIDTFMGPGSGEPWSVAHYYAADVPAALDPIASAERSGFAATLFTRGNEKVLAMRGSDDAFADLLRADVAQIGVLGIAVSQTVAMVNLLERLRGAAGAPVAQLSVHASLSAPAGHESVRIPGVIDTYLVFERSTATGLGLITPGERVIFTGHSLGGELAAVAALLYPELAAPDVYLFNAAGLDPTTADAVALRVLVGGVGQAVVSSLLAADLGSPAAAVEVGAHRLAAPVLDAIARVLGKPGAHFDFTSPASAFAGLSVHQIRSEDLAPGDDRSVVASAMTGANLYPAALDVTTEANSHVLAPLTDSLALHALFARLDARFDVAADPSLSRLHGMIASASDAISTSEERLVEALYKLFLGTSKRLLVSDAVGPVDNALWTGQGSLAAREDFHAAVLRIRDAADSRALTVVDTTRLTAAELAASAREPGNVGVAMRFALVELDPFAVDGADYSKHALAGRLDRYDVTTGNGALSDAWIDDRADFLARKNAAYAQDRLLLAGTEDRVFHDIEGDIRIEISTATDATGQPSHAADPQRRSFGSDRGEDIAGGGQADHLYGMGGSDRLDGGAGADLLEGGAGADVLRGGDGADTLRGAQGDDLLDGGRGNDNLDGGVGFDTYVVRAGDGGDDRIRDSDGNGRLVIETGSHGSLSAGGYFQETAVGSGVWQSADGAMQLTAVAGGYSLELDSGEHIALEAGSLDGALGIHRVAAAANPDSQSAITDLPAQWLAADLPNWIYREWVGTENGDRLDYAFYRPAPAPATSGRVGRYLIAKGDAGNDWLETDDDFDVLFGEAGADTLIAGRGHGLLNADGTAARWSGADFLYGGAGDDALFSDGREDSVSFLARSHSGEGSAARGDWLAGGSGDDRLMAGDRDDVLSGGEGGDVLMAGRGNDVIVGDADYDASIIDWSLTRHGGTISIDGASIGLPVGNGSDQIYAGSGDDYADGESGNDILYGEDGDDWLEGGAGEDFIDGGAGRDEVLGGDGGDALFGGAGDDRMFGGGAGSEFDGDDWLDGQDGDDVLGGSGGADRLQGGAGDDQLFGDGDDVALAAQGADALYGEDGADFLRGYGGDDVLDGGAGNDELHADDGADTARGGEGDDALFGGEGDDVLDGGDGDDAIAGEAGDDTLAGGDGADTLVGGDGEDRLAGGGGDDKLEGGAGNDFVDGGAGADIISTGIGHDVIVADMQDRLFDEDGDVELILAAGIAASDLVPMTVSEDGVTYSGLLLHDALFYTTRAEATTAQTRYRFADGSALDQQAFLGQQALEAVEAEGTDGADTLSGYGGNDILDGRAGDDVLTGRGGNDTLSGEAGDDALEGGAGDDQLSGGVGADRYRFADGHGHDVIDERGGVDAVDSIEFAADVVPDDVTFLRESGGDLVVRDTDGSDEIRVRGHYADPAQRIERIAFANGVVISAAMLDALPVEAISGSGGNDHLIGTAGDDRLIGLAGDDVLDGGAGNDALDGGVGEDDYVMRLGMGRDTVVDTAEARSHIILDAGLSASDLTAVAQGADLLLGIRGHEDGILIRGYAAQPDRWVIDGADGVQIGIDAVMAGMSDRDVSPVQTARQDYRLRATSQIAGEFLGLGYRFVAPDTLVHDAFSSNVRAVVAKSVQHDVTQIDIVRADGTRSTTQQARDDASEQWEVDVDPLLDGRISIVSRTLVSDAREIVAGGNWQQTDTTAQAVVSVVWQRFDRVDSRTTLSRTSSAVSDEATNTLTTTTTTSMLTLGRTFASGVATGFSTSAPTTTTQPVSARATVHRTRVSAYIEEVQAGNNDNVISGDFTTLVDAGGGNDVVSGAGFQYGADGDDSLSDGTVLLGGAGNDRLNRGVSMEGGAGNDVMQGSDGATVFRIRAGESGGDILADDGDARPALQRWYYEGQLHIADWQLRRDEAGGYLVTGPLANRFDADAIVVRPDGRVAGHSDESDDGEELLRYVAAHPEQAKPILPLPPLPVQAANDFAGLRPFVDGDAFEQDVLELPAGATPESLNAGLVDVLYRSPVDARVQAYRALELHFGDAQSVRIVLPHADDPLGSGIEQLRFFDGRQVTIADVIRPLNGSSRLDPQSEDNDLTVRPEDLGVYADGSGYAIAGRSGDDHITGSAFDDDLSGDEGNDTLHGGAGSDVLWGGEGDDVLDGGEGDDHLFGMEGRNLDLGGAGGDHIQIALGRAAVDAGEGDDAVEVLDARALVAGGSGDDELVIDAAGSIVAVNAGDGHDRLRGSADLTLSVGGGAAAMFVAREADDLLVSIGSDTDVRVENWFADAPGRRRGITLQRIEGDVGIYDLSVLLDALAIADPASGPIAIDAALRSVRVASSADRALGGDVAVQYALHGAFDRNDAQAIAAVVADDAFGITAQALSRPLPGSNHAPVLATPIPDQHTFEDDVFVFALPAATFIDSDAGDRLTFTVTRTDGTALPAWLALDAEGGLHGTPRYADIGALQLRFTATDMAGQQASADMALSVQRYPDLTLRGGAGADTLIGHSGNDILDGGAGGDLMRGARGDDVYRVDNIDDVVVELENEGIDTVQSSISYALPVATEILELLPGASTATGNAVDNTLRGNAAVNVLRGLRGDDSYWVGAGDSVVERAGEGRDAVYADIAWTLSANVEELRLIGGANIDGTGNALNNLLVGNDGDNTLSGASGEDEIRGGAGDDVMIVNSVGDVVVEAAGEGNDTVRASVSYTLPSDVESLVLTGTAALTGKGNALDNRLRGNAGNNELAGGGGDDLIEAAGGNDTLRGDAGNDVLDGGAGDDAMAGGAGDDRYVVGSAGDSVREDPGQGIDAIVSSISFQLGDNVEALLLTGGIATNGTGNAASNLIVGSGSSNTLNGAHGNDIVQGLAGADTLSNTSGNDLLDGGGGADRLSGSGANELLIGGPGNDVLAAGGGFNIIAVNAGDGKDVVSLTAGATDALTLGGGIRYTDLTLSRAANDLVLRTSADDQVTFKDWYLSPAMRTVTTLQVVVEGSAMYDPSSSDVLRDDRVETFDFAKIASTFQRSGVARNWSVMNALLDAHLGGGDDAALGGDLAYRYGVAGALTGVGFEAAQQVLDAANFAQSEQALRASTEVFRGTLRLA